jgi:hypothetical protein
MENNKNETILVIINPKMQKNYININISTHRIDYKSI